MSVPAIKRPAPRDPNPPEFDFNGFSKKLEELFIANRLVILEYRVEVDSRTNEINLELVCRPTIGRVATPWNLTD